MNDDGFSIFWTDSQLLHYWDWLSRSPVVWTDKTTTAQWPFWTTLNPWGVRSERPLLSQLGQKEDLFLQNRCYQSVSMPLAANTLPACPPCREKCKKTSSTCVVERVRKRESLLVIKRKPQVWWREGKTGTDRDTDREREREGTYTKLVITRLKGRLAIQPQLLGTSTLLRGEWLLPGETVQGMMALVLFEARCGA